MAWGKAGSTTLSSAGDLITVDSLSNNKCIMILNNVFSSGQGKLEPTLNNDTGSNYAIRYELDGAAEVTLTSQPDFVNTTGGFTNGLTFHVQYLVNIATEEKLLISHSCEVEFTGAGNAPRMREYVGKWANTSDAVSRYDVPNVGTGDFASGSNSTLIGSDLTPAAAIPAIPSLLPSLQSPSVGGWKELARTTLGSGSSDITVSSLPNKRYYMYLINPLPSASNNSRMRFNSDSGSNYSIRRSENGASDTTLTSRTETRMDSSATDANKLIVGYISNLAGKEKLTLSHLVKGGSTGAATAPSREEDACKWVNTSNAIDEITANTGSGSYPTGSEVVVLGWDPADTHTTNFWEELVSVDLSGGTNRYIDSGVFTSKKYLCIQCFCDYGSGSTTPIVQVGNSTIDTGSSYANRRSSNGGSDITDTSSGNISLAVGALTTDESGFSNMFVINNASNEKLFIGQFMDTSSGTGATNAPLRREHVAKWANTSNQINRIQFDSGSGNTFGTNSILKIWGAD